MAAPQGAAVAEAVEGGVAVAGKAAYKGGSVLARWTKACCNAFGGCIKHLAPETVAWLLRVINIGNSVVLGFACFYAYTLVGPTDVTRAFLATYIGVFATLLLLFETRVKWTAKWIRRNFGFLFTYTGRTIFLIFLGAVCFGMLDESQKTYTGYTWCLVTGLATVANAMFNCFIICNHPGFQEMNKPDSHASPAGADPSKMTDAQIRAYLEAHPEVAARVATTDGGAGGAHPEEVAVAVGEDWASGAGKGGKTGGSSGGGMFGGMFGGGGKKKGGAAGAGASPTSVAAFTGEVSGGDAYVPPAIPAAAAPVPAYTPPAAAVPSYSPPAAAAGSSGAGAGHSASSAGGAGGAASGGAGGAGGAFAIDDDNPFATGENPYGK